MASHAIRRWKSPEGLMPLSVVSSAGAIKRGFFCARTWGNSLARPREPRLVLRRSLIRTRGDGRRCARARAQFYPTSDVILCRDILSGRISPRPARGTRGEREKAYRRRPNRAGIEVFAIQGLDDRPTRNFHPLRAPATVNRNDGT